MKPNREDGLHYFIISESNEDGYLGDDLWAKKSAIEQTIKDKLYATALVRVRAHYEIIDGEHKHLASKSFKVSIDILALEEIYDYHRYAGSTDFTIGTSARKEEPKKFLVSFKFDKHIASRYLEEKDFNWLTIESLWFNFYGTMRSSTTLNAELLYGKDRYSFSTGGLGHYSYDKLFKYYTLLCN